MDRREKRIERSMIVRKGTMPELGNGHQRAKQTGIAAA
jgi:hypothetical protein